MFGRRNFVLGVVNGALFQLADTLADSTLVLVALLTYLSASPILIGLVFPLRNLVWYIPQLWVSGFMQVRPTKLPLYRQISVARFVLWFAVAAAVFTVRDRGLLLATIFILLPTVDALGGVSAISFMNVVAKVVPPRQRGDFFAWRQVTGGVLAVAAGLFVRLVLDERSTLVFPNNFGLLLALTALSAAGGMLAFSLIREPAEETLVPRASLAKQLGHARQVLRDDHNYRRFIRMRAALMLAAAAPPFFALFAQQRFGLPPGDIGLYLAAYTAAALLANFAYVRIARRAGHRGSVVVLCLAGLLMVGLTILLGLAGGPLGLPPAVLTGGFLLVFVLLGARDSGIGVAANSLLLDLAPPGQGPLYVGITHSTLGLVLLLAAGGGLVVAAFGHMALFVLAALASLLAVWDAFRLARD